MKKLFLSALALLIIGTVLAQDSTAVYKPAAQNKKNSKRERITNLQRMEEEGDLIFNKYNVFGIRLATDGYGINFEKGYFKTPRRNLFFTAELNEKKSNKEHKVSTPDGTGFNYNSLVPYKINNFYEFKLSIGQEHLLGGKGNKNGVSVTYLYSAGLSLALLKPYLYNIQNSSGYFKRETIDELFNDTTPGIVPTGASGFFYGWSKLSVKPGVNARQAMRFDYGRLNQTISAIEAGITEEFYFSKIPQMTMVPQKQFFFNAYICLLFGSRK